MKARKLPSGSWRCQVYSHTDEDGKRHYKSFTCQDTSPRGKKLCELKAAEFAMEKKQRKACYTFRDACDDYINMKRNVLSPRTVSSYECIRDTHLQSLMPKDIYDITQDAVQWEMDKLSRHRSPKTVRNVHGFLSAVLGTYRPDMKLNTSLPQKVRPKLYVPSDGDVKRLMGIVEGTEMEVPVLLAVFGPMRRGEICALESTDIQGNVVHVSKSMAIKDKKWIIKAPKSYAGDRYITYPDFVIDKLKGIDGRIVKINPTVVSHRFEKILERNNIPHFRFHDLRHYSASVLHAIGIPDSYIMERGGWSSDAVLKAVYRHTIDDRKKEQNDRINGHFSMLYST